MQQYYYTQPSYYYGQYPQRYTPYVYQAPAPASPTQYSKQKERIDIIMKDIEAFISSIGDEETSAKFKAALPGILSNVESTIANAANVPGSSNFEWLSDEEFAAYRERQKKIFNSSADLSGLLGDLDLKFFWKRINKVDTLQVKDFHFFESWDKINCESEIIEFMLSRSNDFRLH